LRLPLAHLGQPLALHLHGQHTFQAKVKSFHNGSTAPAAREILTRCAGNPKSEIRNPKSERNLKIQTPNPKQNVPTRCFFLFFIGDWDFFRISDFGFRISDFPRSG